MLVGVTRRRPKRTSSPFWRLQEDAVPLARHAVAALFPAQADVRWAFRLGLVLVRLRSFTLLVPSRAQSCLLGPLARLGLSRDRLGLSGTVWYYLVQSFCRRGTRPPRCELGAALGCPGLPLGGAAWWTHDMCWWMLIDKLLF